MKCITPFVYFTIITTLSICDAFSTTTTKLKSFTTTNSQFNKIIYDSYKNEYLNSRSKTSINLLETYSIIRSTTSKNISKLHQSQSGNDTNSSNNDKVGGYTPPEQSEALKSITRFSSSSPPTSKKNPKLPPFPKIGDIVRYYDLDGGRVDGQTLVGKISFISPIINKNTQNDSDGTNQWMVEITQLEDVGDGYYTEYSSRERSSKRTTRKLEYIAPLIASYVRSEDAFKVPYNTQTSQPIPSFEQYNIREYKGPSSDSTVVVNKEVIQQDLALYNELKLKLLRDAAIAGLIGTILTDLFRGINDAVLYALGALAGVGYLFFLSIKTDTVGNINSKLGSNVSNLRFALPLIVLVGISFSNLLSGDGIQSLDGSNASMTLFRSVSTEQFACAMIGFLTYRLPLFVSQLGPVISDTAGLSLPGSAGYVMEMAQNAKKQKDQQSSGGGSIFNTENLVTVLLISGPEGTGRSELVQRFLKEWNQNPDTDSDENGNRKFVLPQLVDKIANPTTFEKLYNKDAFLQVDSTGRYGLTKDGILNAGGKKGIGLQDDNMEEKQQTVVVVDADVNLTKKLTMLGGARLVGVWVGLDSLEKFETRLTALIDSGKIKIPQDETKDSVKRDKIRQIVKDIEYGVVSGVFEFTILNDDPEKSLEQLKAAAEYCFK